MSATVLDILFGSRMDGKVQIRPRLPELRERIAIYSKIPHAELVTAILDAIDIPVGNVAISGWNKCRLIREAKVESLAAPGTKKFVRLAEHSIDSTHHPRIELDLNGARIEILRLDLVVSLQIETVRVVVENGVIAGWGPGNAIVSATLSSGGLQLAKMMSKPVALTAREPDVSTAAGVGVVLAPAAATTPSGYSRWAGNHSGAIPIRPGP